MHIQFLFVQYVFFYSKINDNVTERLTLYQFIMNKYVYTTEAMKEIDNSHEPTSFIDLSAFKYQIMYK
jgi:hypothetical protein